VSGWVPFAFCFCLGACPAGGHAWVYCCVLKLAAAVLATLPLLLRRCS